MHTHTHTQIEEKKQKSSRTFWMWVDAQQWQACDSNEFHPIHAHSSEYCSVIYEIALIILHQSVEFMQIKIFG